ncbi:MAG: MBL fold metallo-hydrolase [Kangiellaceae bacterium]|nr:MBL fold metallo-hydrolase [Kangiellaceae bacterium]
MQKFLRIKVISIILLGICGALPSPAISASEKTEPYRIEQVAPGVSVALKLAAHRFIDSNVVILEGSTHRIVIDANDNLANADKLINYIQTSSRKPVKYVINTHWHSDHTLANQLYKNAFKQLKAFVGHESLPKLIIEKTEPQLREKIEQWQAAIGKAEEKLKTGSADKNLAQKIDSAKAQLKRLMTLTIPKPELVFKREMKLDFDGMDVQLLNFGRAHTPGDTIVFLPRQKVLISGDLFDELPYAGHGFPSEWLHTLKEIQRLDFTMVIPGHGEVQKGKHTLERITLLIEESIIEAKIAVDNNQSLEEFQRSLPIDKIRQKFGKLDSLGERVFKQFIPEFYTQAFKELKGELN